MLAPEPARLDAVDNPAAVAATYATEPIGEGLGLLDYSIVPHYRSPDHAGGGDRPVRAIGWLLCAGRYAVAAGGQIIFT